MGVVPERQRCGADKEMIRLALGLMSFRLQFSVTTRATHASASSLRLTGLRSVYSDAGRHWMAWFQPGADSKD
jgi:hypothetical protein